MLLGQVGSHGRRVAITERSAIEKSRYRVGIIFTSALIFHLSPPSVAKPYGGTLHLTMILVERSNLCLAGILTPSLCFPELFPEPFGSFSHNPMCSRPPYGIQRKGTVELEDNSPVQNDDSVFGGIDDEVDE